LVSALLFTVGLAPAPAAGQECIASNGTFRFLNDVFPELSTNGPVFVGQLVVANADGTVTFPRTGQHGLAGRLRSTLIPSGLITGLATQSGNTRSRSVPTTVRSS
jgi:hypothetical protein